MENSIAQQIRQKIIDGGEGRIVFISDFPEFDDSVVGKTLSRLSEAQFLIRLAKGIYLYPSRTRFGILYPSMEEIAYEIGERDRVKILPAGATALNMLGLSTQVPLNAVYVTSGTPRIVKVNGSAIVFRRASPKQFEYRSTLIPLLVLGLKEIGKDSVDEQTANQIRNLVLAAPVKERQHFEQDLQLAPQWIRRLIQPMLAK